MEHGSVCVNYIGEPNFRILTRQNITMCTYIYVGFQPSTSLYSIRKEPKSHKVVVYNISS